MGSTSGALWSDLYYLYMTIAVLVGGLIIGWLGYSLVRFRERPDTERARDAPAAGLMSAERGHPIWSYVMAGLIAMIMFGLAFGTISAIDTIEKPPQEPGRLEFNVIGYQFGWKYNYTGVGGIPFQVVTPGDDHFTVPVDTVVVLHITSQDVWHNFAIPDYRIRVDAIPGTVNPLWFRATETGAVRNVCVQICGANHANMHTDMDVLPQADYETWLVERSFVEFQKFETRVMRDATRGTAVNATLTDDPEDGTALGLSARDVTAGKGVAFHITNNGTSPRAFTVGGRTIDVPAGDDAYLYALAPAAGRSFELTAGDASATLQAVSR